MGLAIRILWPLPHSHGMGIPVILDPDNATVAISSLIAASSLISVEAPLRSGHGAMIVTALSPDTPRRDVVCHCLLLLLSRGRGRRVSRADGAVLAGAPGSLVSLVVWFPAHAHI